MLVHAIAAAALMPVAGHPYDLAALTSASGAWVRWGVPLFYHWKFGFDLSVLAIGSQGLSYALQHFGLSGAAALAVAWKLPLVVADLLVGATLVDLGRQVRSRRPELIAALWLLSPVSLWVSAGHGQIESLTILALVLSVDLLLRRRALLAGLVTGLGIGIEYLPILAAVIAGFLVYASVIRRREACRFIAGCLMALAFCFGPPLASTLGRASLLGGLAFTANVASNPGHAAVTTVSTSLWAVLDLSPGSLWLLAALSAAITIMIVIGRRSRRAGRAGRAQLAIAATGGLLLCASFLDPGALPQFSALVLAGLCLIGLCLDLNPAVIILGPALQLAAGFFYVYGGSFQSFWYDMWDATGTSGWGFPSSLLAQGWAARLGAALITLGLISVPYSRFSGTASVHLRTFANRLAICSGILGLAFLATWSSQPAFWDEVGSAGPSTLADFDAITATQAGTVVPTASGALIKFAPSVVHAARESTISPALALTLEVSPFFAQTQAGTAKFGRGLQQTLTIPDWSGKRSRVASVWVTTLVGKSTWRSPADVSGQTPTLAVYGHAVSSSEATWVSPGWAVITYSVSASRVLPGGELNIALQGNRQSRGILGWNGSAHVRWILVSLHSGLAAATVNGKAWKSSAVFPAPTPSWWLQGMEEASVQRVSLDPQESFEITDVKVGGESSSVAAGSFEWPITSGLDRITPGWLLYLTGFIDLVAVLGGAFIIIVRLARSSARPKSGWPEGGPHEHG